MAEDLAELMSLRTSLLQERRTLAERIARLDWRLTEVDAQLAGFPSHGQHKTSKGSADGPGFEDIASEGGLLDMHSVPPSSMSVTSVKRRPPSALPPELASTVSSTAEALVGETQRSLERLATQQQQRRTQLLAVLTSHLEGEEARLSVLSVAPSGYRGAEAVASEQLGEALQEAQKLCERVHVALEGPGGRNAGLTEFSAGARCRARWVDGTFYDATIHSVQNDGTVVVNWLRPRPSTTDDGNEPPQRTVSEHGGDDTLHRLVSKADVQIDGISPGGHSDTQAALTFFLHRPVEDRSCADCNTKNTDWASVSFGTYLCVQCASEHESLGLRRSLVRPLNDGWGWTKSDLKYMRVGGNVAFHNCLKTYPSVRKLPVLERYASRFAEYYRRHLDALCTGAQQPTPLAAELADQPSPLGDFLSLAEASAAVKDAELRFKDAAMVAASQCQLARNGSRPPASQRAEAPRSSSDATIYVKKRATKVSC